MWRKEMRHIQSSFGDGWLKTAFCVYCGCEDTVELLKDDCPGKFIDKSAQFIDKNLIAVDNSTELD